jgi:hypothetical protein
MSESGQSRRSEGAVITSGLHPMNGHRQTGSTGPFRAINGLMHPIVERVRELERLLAPIEGAPARTVKANLVRSMGFAGALVIVAAQI